jgi:hypothetical protein
MVERGEKLHFTLEGSEPIGIEDEGFRRRVHENALYCAYPQPS